MPTLYIVDGTYNIFRAYHATPPLTNSKGLPTNAVFAFTGILRKLLADHKPTHLAITFDTGKPTFRHKKFVEYKAHRPPPPEDLIPQFDYVRKVCHALNVKVLEKDGYEADDLIATLAEKAVASGMKAIIVSADKDLFQLVREGVSIMNPHKRNLMMNSKKVTEIFGVPPNQVVDVLALMGDSSDNIPGVPGIGEKGAKSILGKFGSLEKAFEGSEEEFISLGRMGKKYFRSLRENREKALLCQWLVTVKRDVPMEIKLEDLAAQPAHKEKAYELFKELEFSHLADSYQPSTRSDLDVQTLFSIEELNEFIKGCRKDGILSVDTETTSTDPMQADLVGISLCSRAGLAAYVPVGHSYLGAPRQIPAKNALEALKPILEDSSFPKIGQNIKYDMIVLRRHDVHIRGVEFDSMVASYLVDPGRRQHNMDALARDYLGHKTITYAEIAGSGAKQVTLDTVDIDIVATYAAEDAEVTLRLKEVLEPKLAELELDELFEKIERPLISVLADVEMTGIKVDPEVLSRMSGVLKKDIQKLEKEIFEIAGVSFNINSPKQLGDILFERLELKSKRKTAKSKARSTSQEVLEQLATEHPLPGKVLEYRSLAKLKGTYVDAIPELINPETGRVHTSYNQTVAATGRLSSTDPNLQNIPARTALGRKIRAAFIPSDGSVFLAADYSQVELRVLAHMADDPAMQKAFQDGEDIHLRTAAQIFDVMPELVTDDMRRQAKTINFGVLYGMGPVRLGRSLSISRKEASDFIEQYFSRFPRIKEYIDKTIEGLEKDGFVTTLFNRRRFFPEIHTNDRMLIQQALRAAVNTTIQGTAADIIKRAMLDVDQALRNSDLQTKMILQVHDELVFEVPRAELKSVTAMVKEKMENACRLSAPLVVDIKSGESWMEVT